MSSSYQDAGDRDLKTAMEAESDFTCTVKVFNHADKYPELMLVEIGVKFIFTDEDEPNENIVRHTRVAVGGVEVFASKDMCVVGIACIVKMEYKGQSYSNTFVSGAPPPDQCWIDYGIEIVPSSSISRQSTFGGLQLELRRYPVA